MQRSSIASNHVTQIPTALGLVGFAWVGAAYVASLAGALIPEAWVLRVGVPALFLAAVTYIRRFPRTDETPIFFRWWMPALWLALSINSAVVWQRAEQVTRGGHIEQRHEQTVLVAHGTVVRQLDVPGARVVALWQLRQTSSHLLTMLGFAAFGLLAVSAKTGQGSTWLHPNDR